MPGRMSPMVGLRLDPDVHRALKVVSDAERRSMAAQASLIIERWLQAYGYWKPAKPSAAALPAPRSKPARSTIPASYRLEPVMLQRVMDDWLPRKDVRKAAGYDDGVEELMTRHAKEANPPCVVLRRNTKSKATGASSSYHLRPVGQGEVPGQLIEDDQVAPAAGRRRL